MRRRSLLVGSGTFALAPTWPAWAQQVARVGVLVTGSRPHPIAEILPRELAALGYVEGKTISFDIRYADRSNDHARMLARELVASGCDVIVTHFTPAAEAAKEATSTTPIVMAAVGAPVETGLVASLAHPGGNITGVSNLSTEIEGRRVQVLHDIIPNLSGIAAVVSKQDPFAGALVAGLQQAAARLGIRVEAFWRVRAEEMEASFAAIDTRQFQAVVAQGLSDQAQRKMAIELATARRLPVMAFEREVITAGGLASVVGSSAEIYRRVAGLVDRVLKGAKPADLPVEQPTAVETIINLRTARKLGLTVPASVLVSADEVIE